MGGEALNFDSEEWIVADGLRFRGLTGGVRAFEKRAVCEIGRLLHSRLFVLPAFGRASVFYFTGSSFSHRKHDDGTEQPHVAA